MCLSSQWSLQWPKQYEINQVRMFGFLYNQMIVHTTWGGGIMFLPLNTHSNKSRTDTWAWSRAQIIDSHIMVCSSKILSFEISHWDSIEFGPHGQNFLRQTQSHMVGMCECRWSYDKGWFHLTKEHCLFGSET